MDFKLSYELVMLKETARDFTEKEIIPYADQWDEEHLFPIDTVKKWASWGFSGA